MMRLRRSGKCAILYTPAVFVVASFFEPTLLPWGPSMAVDCVSQKAVKMVPT